MRYFAIPLAIIGLVVALGTLPSIQAGLDERNSYTEQLHQLDLQQRLQAQMDAQAQAQATSASRALASNTGYLGMAALLVIVVAYIGVQAQRRSVPMVRFHGQLVPRHLIEDGSLITILAERLAMDGQAQIAAASRANVPITYSPHLIQRSTDLLLPDTAAAATSIDVLMPRDNWMGWVDEQPHTLLAGKTKAGKTWLATALLERRLRDQETVFIIDPHSSGWLSLPTAGSAANDGELARALGAVLGEYLRRMQARDAHKKETGQELPHDYFGRLTVLIDEANAISDELKTQWTTICKQLASGSRKVGISLLLMAQSPLVEDLNISGAMRENFARIGLDDRSVQLLIDGERDKARKDALRAALVGMDRPAAAQIGSQVWLLDRRGLDAGTAPSGARSQVWRGWDFDRGCRVMAPTIEQAETLKQKVSAYETPGTEFQEFQINPEIAEIVRRLRNEGKSKTQVIYLVWNAKPGGSKSFKDASAAYDAIVGEQARAA